MLSGVAVVSVYDVVSSGSGATSVAADAAKSGCAERCTWYSTRSSSLADDGSAYADHDSRAPVACTVRGSSSCTAGVPDVNVSAVRCDHSLAGDHSRPGRISPCDGTTCRPRSRSQNPRLLCGFQLPVGAGGGAVSAWTAGTPIPLNSKVTTVRQAIDLRNFVIGPSPGPAKRKGITMGAVAAHI